MDTKANINIYPQQEFRFILYFIRITSNHLRLDIMENSQFALLNKRRFLPLFMTQFLGAFNDNTFKNALVILITYRLADLGGYNAQILVTLAAGLFILPFFLFSATAGQLADKYEKSKMIVIIKFIEIILMLLATLGFYLQSAPLLMFVL